MVDIYSDDNIKNTHLTDSRPDFPRQFHHLLPAVIEQLPGFLVYGATVFIKRILEDLAIKKR